MELEYFTVLIGVDKDAEMTESDLYDHICEHLWPTKDYPNPIGSIGVPVRQEKQS